MSVSRRKRTVQISDEGLRCFIQWARENVPDVVYNPTVARGVLDAYAQVREAVPGAGHPTR